MTAHQRGQEGVEPLLQPRLLQRRLLAQRAERTIGGGQRVRRQAILGVDEGRGGGDQGGDGGAADEAHQHAADCRRFAAGPTPCRPYGIDV